MRRRSPRIPARLGRSRASLAARVVLLIVVAAGCAENQPTPEGLATATVSPTASEDPTPTPTATAPAATSPATEPPEDPVAEPSLELVVAALVRPVAVVGPDDGSGDLYVVEQPGRILRLPGGSGPPQVALDIRKRVGSEGNEQGLLGLAFSPTVADDGRVFVDYTDRRGDTVIAEFRISAGRIARASERVILRVDQPAANHNGGDLHFGPDGMLYVSLGDGGGGGSENGRRRDTLLGKILRLDVLGRPDAGPGYAIPPDNPFVGEPGTRPEIWATGLRNPWRFSIESGTGALWIGDVGAGDREEIDHAPVGGLDFGWDRMEGTLCHDPAACDDVDLVAPIAEYGHDEGCVVTGGLVYAGLGVEALAGRYLFADYCSGRISTLDALLGYGSVQSPEPLLETGRAIVAFGQDADGEVLVVDHDGEVLRLVTAP